MDNNYPKPKKKLGQNFLISPYYAERVASIVKAPDDRKVVEIGPGMGAVSIFLKKKFPKFHLIEKDKDVIPFLEKKLGNGEWTLHIGNILNFDFSEIGSQLHVVGNLPYNIAAMIIKKTLLLCPDIESITFMVQREVAERIVAKPHTKKIGFLSIFCQFFGTPKIAFHVPPGVFFPKPRVDSSVFQLYCDSKAIDKLPKKEWSKFFEFVSRGFSKRRKKLANALSWNTESKAIYEKCIEQIDLNQKVRPEDLSINDWLELYYSVKEIMG